MNGLIRVGDRVLALPHIIEVAPEGAGPRCDRVHVTPGRAIDLDEAETRDLRAILRELAPYRRHRHAIGLVVDEAEAGGEVGGD